MITDWPRATPLDSASGWIRSTPEDFFVSEIPQNEPTGEGEHLFIRVEKVNLTTRDLVDRLADVHGVSGADIGFAGMKDKRARTRQWLSLPVAELAAEIPLAAPLCLKEGTLEVLESHRHQRKLRRGELAGNRFDIVIRQVEAIDELFERLELLKVRGAPNYFGTQRFGRTNIADASLWLSVRRRRRIPRFQQGLYLSVLRSLLFNEVLAARVRAGNWRDCIPGDRCEDGIPTGPLWGRGRSATADCAAELEAAALKPHAQICEGLEYAGLQQARRSLVLVPEDMDWEQVADDAVRVRFSLPAGGYATSLLGEALALHE